MYGFASGLSIHSIDIEMFFFINVIFSEGEHSE